MKIKYFVFVIINLVIDSIFAQSDSLKNNSISLGIEVGAIKSIFLNNYPQNNNFTPGLFQPFTEYIPPHTIGVKILNGSKYVIGFNYIYFNKSNSFDNRIQGDVIDRFYHAVSAELGKCIEYNNFTLSPTFNINFKLSGIEAVLVGYIPGSWGEPIIQTFQYNSFGVGFGSTIKYYVLPNFYISTDLRYSHNFEKNKTLGKPLGGFEEFYKNYRVNRDAITLSLNFGYQIKIRN